MAERGNQMHGRDNLTHEMTPERGPQTLDWPRLPVRWIALLGTIVFLMTSISAFGGHVANGHLVAVGPIASEAGFPIWYKGGNGLSLELCLGANNPLCGFLPGEVPDPPQPLSVPD